MEQIGLYEVVQISPILTTYNISMLLVPVIQ